VSGPHERTEVPGIDDAIEDQHGGALARSEVNQLTDRLASDGQHALGRFGVRQLLELRVRDLGTRQPTIAYGIEQTQAALGAGQRRRRYHQLDLQPAGDEILDQSDAFGQNSALVPSLTGSQLPDPLRLIPRDHRLLRSAGWWDDRFDEL
jgi:hypothetical protein